MTDLMQNAITSWMLIGIAISLLIQLTAGPLAAYWERIPAALRPTIAGLVGMLGACAESLVSGRTWKQALLALVVTGALPAMLVKRSPVADKPPTV